MTRRDIRLFVCFLSRERARGGYLSDAATNSLNPGTSLSHPDISGDKNGTPIVAENLPYAMGGQPQFASVIRRGPPVN